MTVVVRAAAPADDRAIGRVLVGAGRRPWSAAQLAPAEDRIVLVAEQDGAVVACARTDRLPVADHGAPAGYYLGGLVVASEARRQGIGRMLVDARLGWLLLRADAVHSVANAGNAASLAMHAATGFVEVERGSRFGPVRADRAGDCLVLLRRDVASGSGL